MARRARVVFPRCLYHVTQRGNNKQFIFENNNDYIFYLKQVEECRQKTGVDIFAYCLMGNHVHFIVRPNDNDGLAKMFQMVHMRYAQYFQTKYYVTGHVWQGRFYSCLLFGGHISEALRYVELNPVRAGIAAKAWQYIWSSARAHIGKRYKLITLSDIREYVAVEDWKHYLSRNGDEEFFDRLRSATKKNLVLGPESFILNLEKQLGRKIVRKMGRPKVGTDPTL